jgi:uncharacterized protein YjbI with pentapeptide repeats
MEENQPDPNGLHANCFVEDKVFSALTVENLDLTGADFTGCFFKQCRFPGALLRKARFEQCEFDTVDLSNAIVTGCLFIDCKFTGCKLLGINWTQAREPLSIELDNCHCDESNFFAVNLAKLQMTGCSFRNADFREAKLTRANLNAGEFSGALFGKTDLSFADMRDCRNYSIDVRDNTIRKAKFSLPEAMNLLSGLDIVLE